MLRILVEADVVGDADKTREQLLEEVALLRQKADQLEQALRNSLAKLKQSQEEFRTFVYIVSHDLRNPLINLKGFAAELRSSLESLQPAIEIALPHLDEKQREVVGKTFTQDIPESLNFIEFSVGRIDSFMNAILKLSRLSRRPLKIEAVDMNALVQETLKSLADLIEAHHATVTVKTLPVVMADRAAMEEIWFHILKNAVVYLDAGRPGEVEVYGESEADEVVFHVRDNGRGIADEDKHKVLEPFRRAGRPDVPGEGMGLSYVQVLVQRLGGRVSFESKLGVGTTFTFTVSKCLGGDAYAG